jgi:hypothetical protein
MLELDILAPNSGAGESEGDCLSDRVGTGTLVPAGDEGQARRLRIGNALPSSVIAARMVLTLVRHQAGSSVWRGGAL